jgi:hypothetical protein
MLRRLSRVVQVVRDVVVLLFSIILVSTSIGPGKETASLLLAAVAGVLASLSAVDLVLNVARVKGKGYFYACSYVQLAVGIVMLGLFLPYGVALIVLNLAVLVSLHEKKMPVPGEGPPPPLTRSYRLSESLASVALLAGLLLPLISSSSSLLGVYLGIMHLSPTTTLPTVSLGPAALLFAVLTLLLTPISLVTSLLGIFRRRFALLTGLLAVAGSAGWIVSLDVLSPEAHLSAGLGAYAILAGGAVALAAYLMARKGSGSP